MDIKTVTTYLQGLFATLAILLTMLSPAFGNSGDDTIIIHADDGLIIRRPGNGLGCCVPGLPIDLQSGALAFHQGAAVRLDLHPKRMSLKQAIAGSPHKLWRAIRIAVAFM